MKEKQQPLPADLKVAVHVAVHDDPRVISPRCRTVPPNGRSVPIGLHLADFAPTHPPHKVIIRSAGGDVIDRCPPSGDVTIISCEEMKRSWAPHVGKPNVAVLNATSFLTCVLQQELEIGPEIGPEGTLSA